MALKALINQDGAQFVDHFRTGLEIACTGHQLSYAYTLTHISRICLTSVEVQVPTPRGGGGGGAADANVKTLAPPKPSTPPNRGSCGHFNKARRWFFFHLLECQFYCRVLLSE